MGPKQLQRLADARATLHRLAAEHAERVEREREHRRALAYLQATAPRYVMRRARWGVLAVERV